MEEGSRDVEPQPRLGCCLIGIVDVICYLFGTVALVGGTVAWLVGNRGRGGELLISGVLWFVLKFAFSSLVMLAQWIWYRLTHRRP
jgi:hypothetical protein